MCHTIHHQVLYDANIDKTRLVLEAAFIIGVVYWTQKYARRLKRQKGSFFIHPVNWFELFILFMDIVMVVQWSSFVLDPKRVNFDVQVTHVRCVM